MKKTNYLNNRDILKEIHKSKSAYCSYSSPAVVDYDLILSSTDEIFPRLEEARIARADRLTRSAQDLAIELGKKKNEAIDIDPTSIPNEDIVFRVMTWSHIPEAPPAAIKIIKTSKDKKTKIVIEEEVDELITEYDEELPEIEAPSPKYIKVNFPPFQHFQINTNNDIVCVGKSHWKGDIDAGSFSKDHGKITSKLALIYMKLVERYATRANWRGYSYNDEMKSQALLQLSQIGLQFDENKSANPFAYYTTSVTNSFRRVLNIEKKNQVIRDDILEINSMNPSYTRQNAGSSNHSSSSDEF